MHRNTKLIVETIGVFILISSLALWTQRLTLSAEWKAGLYAPLLLFQGFWFYRFYIVGHEAAHKKLFADKPALNDFWGSVILLPLMTPITVYRKIHYFHHGFNRKDEHTSNLDTFVVKRPPGFFRKVYCYVVWYLSVFFGGFFIHSLVLVVLFLFMPPALSVKISPAFKGWTMRDQWGAIGLFALGVLLHGGVYWAFGKTVYLYTLGYPMLAFGWILSLLVYIFHYDTTIGDGVRYNVRSVKRVPVISWILMNFNEHATHHQYPNIPWYELPEKQKTLPEPYLTKNQRTWNFFRAIFNQLKGPNIVHEHHH